MLRENLESHASITALNGGNFGTVTLFRVYPDNVDTWTIKETERSDASRRDEVKKHNEYNRQVFRYLHDKALEGEGILVSLTECSRHSDYGVPIVALKSYILPPFVDEEHVELLAQKILEARGSISDPPAGPAV